MDPTPAPNNVTVSLRGGGDSRGVVVPLYLPIVSLMIPTYKSGLAAAKAAARPILNFPQVCVCIVTATLVIAMLLGL